MKGTGKTALLWYIRCMIDKLDNTSTQFILFRSDISSDDREKLGKAASVCSVSDEATSSSSDYEDAWEWYFHRQIVSYCEDNNIELFEKNEYWKKYCKCVNMPVGLDDEKKNSLPKVKKGKIQVKANLPFADLGIEADFEPGNSDFRQVSFSSLVAKVHDLFSKLTPTNRKLYFFVDELELSFVKTKQYKKDVLMIRDIVVTITKLNTLSRKKNFGLYIITGIRSEVIASTNSVGKEINKPIADFGVVLKWAQAGVPLKNHPLMKIILKRILAAHVKANPDDSVSEDKIWDMYFPDTIGAKPTEDYIMFKTWFRPRDLVRFFNLVRQHSPALTSFSAQSFDKISIDYSKACWVECSEELQASYSESDIDAISDLLMALECPFSYNEIELHAKKRSELYDNVASLISKKKLGDLLNHLYSLGIIGNCGDRTRFAFRGDNKLIVDYDMKVHDALWNHFAIKYRSKR